LQGISDLAERYGLGVANVFHAGDGNLHPLILYDVMNPGELEICGDGFDNNCNSLTNDRPAKSITLQSATSRTHL